MATATATRMAKVELSAVTEIPTATKMAVFGDPDGNGIRLLGYMDMGSGFVPLSGTEVGKPITGDLEFILDGDDGYSLGKSVYLTGALGVNYEDNETYLSSFSGGFGYYNKITEENSAMEAQSDRIAVSSNSSGFKGIYGNIFFDKLNNPNAFAQLGDIGTGFNQATLSTPQAITASTPTVITLSGATEQENGDLNLLDISTNTITPIQQGDIITVDFAFPFETPAGTGHYGYIEIREKTTGFVVREISKNFIKGAGNDDIFSASFVIPIGNSTFVTNGFEIVITTSVGITLESKYIAVTRTHTAK